MLAIRESAFGLACRDNIGVARAAHSPELCEVTGAAQVAAESIAVKIARNIADSGGGFQVVWRCAATSRLTEGLLTLFTFGLAVLRRGGLDTGDVAQVNGATVDEQSLDGNGIRHGLVVNVFETNVGDLEEEQETQKKCPIKNRLLDKMFLPIKPLYPVRQVDFDPVVNGAYFCLCNEN